MIEWIDCRERSPEKGEQVLMYRPTDYDYVGGIKLESGAPKGISSGLLRYGATHWMPLPKPPLQQ